jgi:hypothetical protein
MDVIISTNMLCESMNEDEDGFRGRGTGISPGVKLCGLRAWQPGFFVGGGHEG